MKWILFKDEKPPTNKKILLAFDNGNIYIGFLELDNEDNSYECTIDNISEEEWDNISQLISWCPIPELPKKEQKPMTFTEAMNELFKGKKIRQSDWQNGYYLSNNGGQILICDGDSLNTCFHMRGHHFKATNWLICEV